MFKFIILILFTSFLTFTSVSQAASCKQIAEKDHLGRGAFANVYKVKLADVSYVAHKVYDRMGGGGPYPESISRLELVQKEAEKMSLFSQIFNKAGSSLRVAKVLDIDASNQFNLKEIDIEHNVLDKLAPTLILEYIDGITVYELIEALGADHFPRDWLDREKAEEAINFYNNQLEKLDNFLSSPESPYTMDYHYFSSEGFEFLSGDYYINALDLEVKRPLNFSDKLAIISVSPDNVLFTSDGELVLIDPY